jgi:hypothetical protein
MQIRARRYGTSEHSLNRSHVEQAKDAKMLDPKGKVGGMGVSTSPVVDVIPTGEKSEPNPFCYSSETG